MTHNITVLTHKSRPAFWKTLLQAEETEAKTAMGEGVCDRQWSPQWEAGRGTGTQVSGSLCRFHELGPSLACGSAALKGLNQSLSRTGNTSFGHLYERRSGEENLATVVSRQAYKQQHSCSV